MQVNNYPDGQAVLVFDLKAKGCWWIFRLSPSLQLDRAALANEIKHDHSPVVINIVVLDRDTINHTRPCMLTAAV